jgi:hypothetical protein
MAFFMLSNIWVILETIINKKNKKYIKYFFVKEIKLCYEGVLAPD